MQTDNNKLFNTNKSNEALKWHSRFGHLNYSSLQKLVNEKIIPESNVIIPKLKIALCV